MLQLVFMVDRDLKEEILNLIDEFERHDQLEFILAKLRDARQELQSDWWDQLSPEQRSRVEEGIADYNAGRVHSNEEVMEEFKKWRTE